MKVSLSSARFVGTKTGAKRAFTLIELLVVIAIIAILASILFPVFGRARENARRSSCQSNLKQIGLGIIQYTQDYDETFPVGNGSGWWQVNWSRNVQPYLKSVQVFRCPSDPGAPIKNFGTFSTAQLSYVSNGYTAWNGSSNELYGVMGRAESWINPNVTKLAAVTQAASSIMVSEKAAVWPTVASEDGPAYDYGPGVILTGGTYQSDKIPDGTRAATTNPYNPDGPNGGVMAIHFDQANFLFVDGHVKSMRPAATNPGGAANNMWNTKR